MGKVLSISKLFLNYISNEPLAISKQKLAWRKFGGANDFECPCGKAYCSREVGEWGVSAESDSLVNKSCQMSLSYRSRSSSGSAANSEDRSRSCTTDDEAPLSCTSLL